MALNKRKDVGKAAWALGDRQVLHAGANAGAGGVGAGIGLSMCEQPGSQNEGRVILICM